MDHGWIGEGSQELIGRKSGVVLESKYCSLEEKKEETSI